jgi:hypothetical protein
MQEKQGVKKKGGGVQEEPVHTIRAGDVEASIWRRQSPSGYSYLDFSVVRSFTSRSSGNVGYSKNFFARNQQDLARVIEQATRWIAEHEMQHGNAEAVSA